MAKRHTIAEAYDAYIAAYNKTREKVEKAGGVSPAPMNILLLKNALNEEKLAASARGKHASSITKLATKIGNDDAKPYSVYQAKKINQALAMTGNKPMSINKLRMVGARGTPLAKLAEERNKELKAQGVGSKQRQLTISQEIYGSE